MLLPPRTRISALWVYPVKAMQGVSVAEAELTASGTLRFDREWCVVDRDGDRYPALQSLSQRLCPVLASVAVKLTPTQLVLSTPAMPKDLVVDLLNSNSRKKTDAVVPRVVVECGGASTTSAGSWHLGLLEGADAGGAAASEWLTTYLNQADKDKRAKPHATFLLVRAESVRKMATYMGPAQVPFSTDTDAQRLGEASPFRMQDVPARANDGVMFHDVAPLHVASTASLEHLRRHIRRLTAASAEACERFGVANFRPNVVLSGPLLRPWEEESWKAFSLGSGGATRRRLRFRMLKGCPRCTVPARDPLNGGFLFGAEARLAPQKVLRTLFPEKCTDDEWEREWEGPIFGIHAGLDLEEEDDEDDEGRESSGESGGGGGGGREEAERRRVLRVGDVLLVESRKRAIGSGFGFGFGVVVALVVALSLPLLLKALGATKLGVSLLGFASI
jgi:uncharacterized protein YcbX